MSIEQFADPFTAKAKKPEEKTLENFEEKILVIEEKRSGVYDQYFPIWQQVKKTQEYYEALQKENTSLNIKLQAQIKQNKKIKDELYKLEGNLAEAMAFMKKMRNWKSE